MTDMFACVDHPVLHPDAWSEVINGQPQGEGIQASIVCQFVCSARDKCPVPVNSKETIGRGGWFNARSQFFKPYPGYMNISHAATYLGLRITTVAALIEKYQWKTLSISGRRWILVTDVKSVAGSHGPKHGTPERWRLHFLHGTDPCHSCKESVSEPIPV